MQQAIVSGWFTLAMINAGLAQGKGHGGLAWFLVSLLIGPIATFLIVAVLSNRFRKALRHEMTTQKGQGFAEL